MGINFVFINIWLMLFSLLHEIEKIIGCIDSKLAVYKISPSA
jgi:hypothetical protein